MLNLPKRRPLKKEKLQHSKERASIQKILRKNKIKTSVDSEKKSNLLQSYVKQTLIKMLQERKKKAFTTATPNRQQLIHAISSKMIGKPSKNMYEQYLTAGVMSESLTFHKTYRSTNLKSKIRSKSQMSPNQQFSQQKNDQIRNQNTQLINPCSKGFKYCINKALPNNLKNSLLSKNFLLQPCKIKTYKLEQRPYSAVEQTQKPFSTYRSNQRPSRPNFIRSMDKGPINFLNILKRKSVSFKPIIKKEQMIQPWEIQQMHQI